MGRSSDGIVVNLTLYRMCSALRDVEGLKAQHRCREAGILHLRELLGDDGLKSVLVVHIVGEIEKGGICDGAGVFGQMDSSNTRSNQYRIILVYFLTTQYAKKYVAREFWLEMARIQIELYILYYGTLYIVLHHRRRYRYGTVPYQREIHRERS